MPQQRTPVLRILAFAIMACVLGDAERTPPARRSPKPAGNAYTSPSPKPGLVPAVDTDMMANISSVALDVASLPATVDLRRFISDTKNRLYASTVPAVAGGAGAQAPSQDWNSVVAANVNCSVSAAFVQMDGFTGAVIQKINDTVPLSWSYNITPGYLSVDPVCIVSDDYYNPSSSYTPYFSDDLNAGARRGAVMATDAAGTQLVWASIVSVGRRYDPYPMAAARSTLLVRHINLTTGAARTVLSANMSGTWLLGVGFPATAAIAASGDFLSRLWAAAGLVDMVFMPGSTGRQGDSVLLLPRFTPSTAGLYYMYSLALMPPGTAGHIAPFALRVDLATGACTAAPLLGLGTPLLGIAFDDLTPGQAQPPQQIAATPAGAADSGRLQQQQQPAAAYLLYADTSPVSVDACDPRGTAGVLHSGALTQPPFSGSLCYPHYVLREQQQAQAQAQQSQQPRRQQSVLQMEFTQKYPTSLFTSPYTSSTWSLGGLTEVPILALNRRHAPSSTATAATAAAAAPPVYLYLADRDRCQVRRVDPLTGASAVVAGYDGSSSSSSGSSSNDGLQRRSFLCSLAAQDGPALGQPMGRPGRITRGAPGTVFVLEDWQQPPGAVPLRIRRISGV